MWRCSPCLRSTGRGRRCIGCRALGDRTGASPSGQGVSSHSDRPWSLRASLRAREPSSGRGVSWQRACLLARQRRRRFRLVGDRRGCSVGSHPLPRRAAGMVEAAPAQDRNRVMAIIRSVEPLRGAFPALTSTVRPISTACFLRRSPLQPWSCRPKMICITRSRQPYSPPGAFRARSWSFTTPASICSLDRGKVKKVVSDFLAQTGTKQPFGSGAGTSVRPKAPTAAVSLTRS